MTYQEILQAEKFLQEIEDLSLRVSRGDALFQEAKTLDNKIGSSYPQYKTTGYNWTSMSYLNGDNQQYCSAIAGALNIMHSALQAILNREPNYGKISQVQLDLSRFVHLVDASNEQKRSLIIELVGKYSGYIKFDKSFNEYVAHGNDWGEEDKSEVIFKALWGALNLYLENLTSTNSRIVKSDAKTPTIQVVNNQTNNQTVTLNLEVSIENCLKELDDCETLKEEEINEIKKQLEDIQELLKDKKGKRKTIREKISSALKWVADKGTDAMIALLPTLVMILTNLQMT